MLPEWPETPEIRIVEASSLGKASVEGWGREGGSSLNFQLSVEQRHRIFLAKRTYHACLVWVCLLMQKVSVP